MSKFNQALRKVAAALMPLGPSRLNRAGGLAYGDTPRMALYRQVATSLWNGDGYYETHADWLARFKDNVAAALAEDVRFPFALAAYARDPHGLGLRTTPLALLVEAAAHPASKGSGLIRRYAPQVLRRADEPAEAIAYFRSQYSGVIPHGLLRGIQTALRGFDEYQLAKYKSTGAVSMRDVLRLARPKPRDDAERDRWARTVAGELATPYTWEVELSQATTDEAKRAKWNELLAARKLGLFALVRNLRNILKVGADIEEALSQITPGRVKGSGIQPFQWYKAYRAVADSGGAELAAPLQAALELTLAELPRLSGTTLVACDNSGSMASVSPTRGLSYAEIGNLLGAMALHLCQTGVAATFGEHFAIARTNPRHDLFYNKAQIDACGRTTGHATNAWKVFEHLIRNDVRVDRVILISDMQCYDSGARGGAAAFVGHTLSGELDAYLKINPQVTVYSINLAAQDNSCQFAPHQPVVELAGWSEALFQFMTATETDESILDRILEHY